MSQRTCSPSFRHETPMTIVRSIWIRLLAAGVTAAVLLIPTVTLANGWEHAAVPFDALLQALRFPAPETRRRAAVSLGARGQPEAIAPLLETLQRPEPNPRVRGAIYASLGRFGRWQAGPALLRCLRSEDREEVRAECVVALGELGDKRGLAALLDALAGERSVLVRSRCVEALGHFDARESVAALATIVGTATDPGLRPRAIRSLGRTGADAAIEPLLACLTETPGRREQLLIIQALAELGSARAGPSLRALAEKNADPELRAHLAMALGAVRDGGARWQCPTNPRGDAPGRCYRRTFLCRTRAAATGRASGCGSAVQDGLALRGPRP